MSGKKTTTFLQRSRPKKADEFIICAFDMETRGLGGEFIICAFWAEDGEKYVAYSIEDAFNWMVDHPQYRYLAHNASGYEFAYLYPVMYEYFCQSDDIEIRPTIQGDSRIVQFVIKRGKQQLLDIRDTLCLFNSNLAGVAHSFCPELPKGEPPWNKAHDNFDPTQKIWMDYLWRDCEVILIAYRRFVTMITEIFFCHVGVTAGSTSIKAFKADIPEMINKQGKTTSKMYPRLNAEAEKFMREGYYGAAVFPGHNIGSWGRVAGVDVNAAYGYQMGSHEFPVSAPFGTNDYEPGLLGMYRVIATVPYSIIQTLGFSPIPHRTKNGLVWGLGTFETVISSMEIEYGLKHGCRFDVLEGYVWTSTEPVFTSFINKCQELELAEGGKYKPAVKLIRNSLYGKFGSKTTHKTVAFSRDILEGDFTPMTNELTGEIIDGVYEGEETSDADYILPHWAAFITAWERIYLFEVMAEAYSRGAKNLYCDTDSIKGDAHIILNMVGDGSIPIGTTYGLFKLEEICEEFYVIGPKTYYGRDVDGKEVKKAKGVPKQLLKREVYEDALNNTRKQMQFDTVQSVMRLIKQKGGKLPLKRKRTITDIHNSTAWEVNANGEIFPYGYQQNRELLAA